MREEEKSGWQLHIRFSTTAVPYFTNVENIT